MTPVGTIIKFTGHSDDIICVEIITYREGFSPKLTNDEISANHDAPTRIRLQTIGGSRACDVYAHYDGCWHFSVGLVEEGAKLPSWLFVIDGHELANDYTTQLTVDATKMGDLLDKPIVMED